MKRSRSIAVSVTLGAWLIVALPAVAPAESASPSGTQKVVLRVGTVNDLVSTNPFAACCPGDWEMNILNYDMMLAFSKEDLSVSPGLATGCEPSADSMTWTCDIRPGVVWSDGVPLTSRDIAFTYRFILDNNIPNYRDYLPFHPSFETPNDTTLIWKSPEPTFAPIIPPWIYILPEHIWSQYDGAGVGAIKHVKNVPSVGSGPFTLQEWQQGEGWRMEANEHYWAGAPHIDEVVFQVFQNQESMVQALRQGAVDIVDGIEPGLYAALQGDQAIQVHRTIADWWLNLAFNFGGQGDQATNLPALHDLTVRKAIAEAIDKEAIARVVYAGTAAPGDTVVRPSSRSWHLDIPQANELPFDKADAAKLLQDAGYIDSDGDGIREDPSNGDPLNLEMLAVTTTAGATDAGSLIEGWLSDIGIGVELKPVSEAKVYDLWATGEFDAYIWYWSGDPDPDFQLSAYTTDQCLGWSDGCYSDPTYDRMYLQQKRTLDVDERHALVDRMQQYLYDQVPNVVLAYPSNLQAYRTDRFTGWVPAPGPDGYLVGGGYGSWSYLNITPAPGAGSGATPGLPASAWAGIVIGIGLILALVAARRRLGRDEAA